SGSAFAISTPRRDSHVALAAVVGTRQTAFKTATRCLPAYLRSNAQKNTPTGESRCFEWQPLRGAEGEGRAKGKRWLRCIYFAAMERLHGERSIIVEDEI